VKKTFVLLIFILCTVSRAVLVYCDELTVQFSELEKYLGNPVPANAQRLDVNDWSIVLFESETLSQYIILTDERRIVMSAEYYFTSTSAASLVSLRGTLINVLEQYGEYVKKIDTNTFWVLKQNSGLSNKPLFVCLAQVNPASQVINVYDFRISIVENKLTDR